VVDQKKKVVLYNKSTFFQVGEKWLTRKKKSEFEEPLFYTFLEKWLQIKWLMGVIVDFLRTRPSQWQPPHQLATAAAATAAATYYSAKSRQNRGPAAHLTSRGRP
jgi:hypothetical protein